MDKAYELDYVGSAAKVVGRLTVEALKRHSVWSEDDIAINLENIIPDEETRRSIMAGVASAVECAVKSKLKEGMPVI